MPPINVGTIPYYAYSSPVGRPGIITALLIVSIIVSGIALLANMLTMVITIRDLQPRAFRATKVTATVTTPPPAMPAPSGEQVAPQGLSKGERQIVINALLARQAMPQVQIDHLMALLAEKGKQIIPLRGQTLTPATMAVLISRVYKIPDNSGTDDASGFDLQSGGRLQISNRGAVFFPSQGAAVRLDQTSDTAQKTAPPPPPPITVVPLPPPARVPLVVVAMLQLESILGLLMAAALLAIGIMGLCHHRRTRRLYLAYAIAKLTLVAGTVLVCGIWVWRQTNAPVANVPVQFILATSLLGGIFPLLVLILCFIEPLRTYYNAPVVERF